MHLHAKIIKAGWGCCYLFLKNIQCDSLQCLNQAAKEIEIQSTKKLEETCNPCNGNDKPHTNPSHRHHTKMAMELHHLTEEINAVLLEAVKEKQTEDMLLALLIRLIGGYKFYESDPDLLLVIKEIVILEAWSICHIQYRIEQLILT